MAFGGLVSQFLRMDMGPMSEIPIDDKHHLFLGTIFNGIELETSPRDKFWAVLNCTDDPALDFMRMDAEFDVLRLNQLDGEPYPGMLIKVGIEFIDMNLKAGTNVLVCCHAGVSRSPGMVLAYLIYRQLEKIPREKQTIEDRKLAYSESIQAITKARPFIQIHPQIEKSIRQYYRLSARTAADLIGG